MSRYGYTSIRVLPDLENRPWDDVAKAYLRALRPSAIREVIEDGEIKSDAKLWHVTVYLTSSNFVRLIEQEVEVELPDGVENGHALRCRLGSL